MSTNQMAVIYTERARFTQAYSQGKITKAQYDTAMAYSNQQLVALRQSAATTPSPMPPNPTSPVIQDNSGLWVRTDYKVKDQKTVGDTTKFTIEPKNKSPQELYAERE